MNPIITSSKVMQNFTVCISQPIRERMNIKKGDQVIISMDQNGEVKLTKAISSLGELAGIGKKVSSLGGWGVSRNGREMDHERDKPLRSRA
jgi:bifunctional DNA-binding transcriptional regulator/antitoxin component of YhaV-PrlF toxin-antitoxin module